MNEADFQGALGLNLRSLDDAECSNEYLQGSSGSMQQGHFVSSPAAPAGLSVPATPLQDTISAEPVGFNHLVAQPEAFVYGESQGDQQWLDLFLQAFPPQTQAQSMQPADDAAVHLAPIDSPSSSEQQPAAASQGFLELPVNADSLQRHTVHDCADGLKSLGGASWLAAFTEAHLQGFSPSMQQAQASQGSAASNAASNESVDSFDGDDSDTDHDHEESDANDEGNESDAVLDDVANIVQIQLCCTLTCRVQRMGSTAVGWGYHAAGAAYGTLLGLKQGVRKSSE